jgi:hypothetical protein
MSEDSRADAGLPPTLREAIARSGLSMSDVARLAAQLPPQTREAIARRGLSLLEDPRRAAYLTPEALAAIAHSLHQAADSGGQLAPSSPARRATHSPWRAAWLVGSLLLGLAVWVLIAVGVIAKNPGADGWFQGILGGFVVGLIVIFMTLVMPALSIFGQRLRGIVGAAAPVADAELDPVLAELEAVRQETKRKISARIALWAPIGIVLGFGFGLFIASHDQHHETIKDLLYASLLGAVAACTLAAQGPDRAYRRLYKERVLPKIAAGFGLQWRCAQPPLDDIRRYALFPRWAGKGASSFAADELYGDYRGLPLSIMDLQLSLRGGGKNSGDIFRGVLVALTLPRGLRGITVIAPDEGLWRDLIEHHGQSLQAVHLEDPIFTKAYQVHASDQISARALLTPAFMQRFMAMRQRTFSTPAALVHDNRMMLTMPTSGGALFAAPSYQKPAGDHATIAAMRGTVAAVLHVADAMFELDQSTRQPAP